MDGIYFLFDGQFDDGIDIEIGLHRPFALADQIRLVGLEAMQTKAVFLRIDGYGGEAEFGGSAKNARGDFTAVQR